MVATSTTSGVNVAALDRIDIDDLLPAALRRDSPFRQLSSNSAPGTLQAGARPPPAKIVVNPISACASIDSLQVL